MIAPERITHADQALHADWCRYVRQVFPRAGFEQWAAWGEWNADYEAWVLRRDGQICAGIGLTRMRLLVDGADRSGWQLGAVGCVPDARGRGYSRELMEAVLQHCGADPVLLFANPNVVDFYPRFGFAPRQQDLYVADCAMHPSGQAPPTLNLNDPLDRARLHALAEHGRACTEHFGARGYGRIATWYAANGWCRPIFQVNPGTLVCAGVEGDVLHIDDIWTTTEFDLAALIPALIEVPIRQLHFGFCPERWWPSAKSAGADDDAFLYLRGLAPQAPGRFPILART